MRFTFREGFYAGLLIAAALGIYLFQLWQPRRQVQLHSLHLVQAIEQKKLEKISAFVDDSYEDQWKQNRDLLAARLRAVLSFARNLHLNATEVFLNAQDSEGEWRARITLTADPNELTALIQERVNHLETPFALHWRRKSGKPWDWKLVGVTNEGLELPTDVY